MFFCPSNYLLILRISIWSHFSDSLSFLLTLLLHFFSYHLSLSPEIVSPEIILSYLLFSQAASFLCCVPVPPFWWQADICRWLWIAWGGGWLIKFNDTPPTPDESLDNALDRKLSLFNTEQPITTKSTLRQFQHLAKQGPLGKQNSRFHLFRLRGGLLHLIWSSLLCNCVKVDDLSTPAHQPDLLLLLAKVNRMET